MKKNITKAILVCAFTCVVLLIIVSFSDFKSIWSTIKKVDLFYLSIAFVVITLYVVLSPLALYSLCSSSDIKIPFKTLFQISSTEFFFNGITPFSTGGQPFQVYAFKRAGVEANKSTGLLLMNFVIYQLVVTTMCLLSLFYYKDIKNLNHVSALIIVGFIMNFLILFLFVGLGCSKTVRRVITYLVRKIAKIKLFSKLIVGKLEAFDEYCTNVQNVFQAMWRKKESVIICFSIKFLLMVVYFSIPFFILKALGITLGMNQLFYIIAMTSFAVTMTCFIPTPGASGGIELAFKSIFISIAGVTQAIVVSGMLLWRLFTYYFLILFGFINYLAFERENALEEKLENGPEQIV